MHLRFIKKVKAEVSLYDPIGVDKEGNELTSTVYLFIIDITLIQKGTDLKAN